MSQYLQFRCGPFRFLLAVERVVEIGEAGAAVAGGTGWRRWRASQLPVLDLAQHLGVAAAARRQQVVVQDDGGPGIVDVDSVDGLVDLGEGDFARLAELAPGLAALVDAVAGAGDGGACLLRLRQPLAWRARWRAAPVPEGTP